MDYDIGIVKHRRIISPSEGFWMAPAPSGLDPATTAWVNAVIAAGGTVSGAQQGYVNTLITGLKADGNFLTSDRLWLYGSENTQQAGIDIINLATWTNHGQTFSANHGYTGDGATTYGDTGFIESTGGAQNYVSGNSCFGFYGLTSGLSSGKAMGTTSGSASYWDMNGTASVDSIGWFPTFASNGLFSVMGTSATTAIMYHNGGSPNSTTGTIRHIEYRLIFCKRLQQFWQCVSICCTANCCCVLRGQSNFYSRS